MSATLEARTLLPKLRSASLKPESLESPRRKHTNYSELSIRTKPHYQYLSKSPNYFRNRELSKYTDNLLTPKGKQSLPLEPYPNQLNWEQERLKRKKLLQEMYMCRLNKYVSAGKFEACQPDETHYSALRLTRNLKKVIGRKKM